MNENSRQNDDVTRAVTVDRKAESGQILDDNELEKSNPGIEKSQKEANG